MTKYDEQTEALVKLIQLPYDQRRERYEREWVAPQVSFQDSAASIRDAGWLSPDEVAERERAAAKVALSEAAGALELLTDENKVPVRVSLWLVQRMSDIDSDDTAS